MSQLPPYALLACDVFQEELEALGGANPPWATIRYLEMGLHDQPDKLREAISKTIDELEATTDIEAIALAYGRCGNGLVGVVAKGCSLILPQAHDCVSILLGSRDRHTAVLKENPGTYFYSPGWVRGKRVPGPDREAYLRDFYAERYGDDEDMIDELVDVDRETFEHHNCAAYVDLTGNKAARAYCQNCAHHLGWSYRPLEGDPSFLRDLILGNWDDERFLRIRPGQTIGADTDGNLTAISGHG